MRWIVLMISSVSSLLAVEFVDVTAPRGLVRAEIVDTDATRMLGLSGRSSLENGSGMLFKFDVPQKVYIWMKDMHFSIDVIWLNRSKIVTFIERDFSPETYTKKPPRSICSKKPDTMYVLEVPAGDAGRLGIKKGSQLRF